LVLVTDGQVGNEDQILANLGKRVSHIRIFTLGIDQAVNDGFLRRLAALGRGACELVESEQRLDQVMDQVHRHIGAPVLTGLHLEPAGFQMVHDTLVPCRTPDLFTGAPLTIMGRYRGAPSGTLALQAGDAAGKPWSASVAAAVRDNPAIASVWARGHIRDLEDRYAIVGGDAQLEKRIVDTSLKFGVLCRFTAFVAVDRAETVNKGGQVHLVTQAVEMPAEWEMFATHSAPAVRSAVSLPRAMLGSPLGARPPSAGQCAENESTPDQCIVTGQLMGPRAAKKTMLAKQVVQELYAGGRVSKKTELAMDDATSDGMRVLPAPSGPAGSSQSDMSRCPGEIPGNFGGESGTRWEERLGPIGIALAVIVACIVGWFLAMRIFGGGG
jgi:Ca-activated chloride channel family protein